MSRRAWGIAGVVTGVVVLGAVGGPLAYAALQEDAAPAATVQAQPEDVDLAADTDGTGERIPLQWSADPSRGVTP